MPCTLNGNKPLALCPSYLSHCHSTHLIHIHALHLDGSGSIVEEEKFCPWADCKSWVNSGCDSKSTPLHKSFRNGMIDLHTTQNRILSVSGHCNWTINSIREGEDIPNQLEGRFFLQKVSTLQGLLYSQESARLAPRLLPPPPDDFHRQPCRDSNRATTWVINICPLQLRSYRTYTR